jgi:hypothetical protein
MIKQYKHFVINRYHIVKININKVTMIFFKHISKLETVLTYHWTQIINNNKLIKKTKK